MYMYMQFTDTSQITQTSIYYSANQLHQPVLISSLSHYPLVLRECLLQHPQHQYLSDREVGERERKKEGGRRGGEERRKREGEREGQYYTYNI